MTTSRTRGSMAQGDSSANGACSQREPIPLQRARAASMAAGSSNFRASQKSVSSSPRPHFRASEAAFSSIPERNNFPRSVCMYSPTFKAAPHNSAIAYRAVLLKEALIKSARVDGERFSVKSRFEKCRNTLCISSFSNRWIGGKYPPSTADDLFRVSSNIISQKEADANINLDAASAIFPAFPHRRRAARERHSLRESPNQSSAAEPRSFCRLIQRFPYLPREAKRISSVATSARVAVPCGSRRPLPIPRSRPTATAQRTAASA